MEVMEDMEGLPDCRLGRVRTGLAWTSRPGERYLRSPSERWLGECGVQERARLLGLVQRALSQGTTKVVVFVSGDQVSSAVCDDPVCRSQHWAELMAKRMPESDEDGPSQVCLVRGKPSVHLHM